MRITYSDDVVIKARRLRGSKGFSYREIANELKISKSTAKAWTEDVVLKPEHRKRLYTKQIDGMTRGANSMHERREREVSEIIANAEREIKLPIDAEALKLFGAALYWAEGSKSSEFAITNSDPALIKFMVQWMENVFKIKPHELRAWLNIYAAQDDAMTKKFWSDITGIPLKNFGKSFIKPANNGFKKNTLYYGTVKVRTRRGTDMRHRVFGWIKAVMSKTYPDLKKIENRWYKLRTYKRTSSSIGRADPS